MAHAEKCPLCNGTGHKGGQEETIGGTLPTCHGCRGKGWVSVQGDADSLVDYYPNFTAPMPQLPSFPFGRATRYWASGRAG